MGTELPVVPVGIVALCVFLIVWLVDFINDVAPTHELPSWLKDIISVAVAESLCFTARVNVLASWEPTQLMSPVLGTIITGLMLAAIAAKVAHPVEKVALAAGTLLKQKVDENGKATAPPE